MIPEEHKNTVISSGLQFMRSITEAYGADEGMKLWDAIASTLDPDVKGQIFFAMITGLHNDAVVLRKVYASSNAVSCIKEIRNWTGYGLKEAKDTYDAVNSGKVTTLKVKREEHHYAVRGLRNVGFEI